MEAEVSWNTRVNAVRSKLTDLGIHTLSRESQEVMAGVILIVVRAFPIDAVTVDPWRVILNSCQLSKMKNRERPHLLTHH